MHDQSRQNQTEVKPVSDPYVIIASFCQDNNLSECQTTIWQLMGAVLSSEDSDLWDKRQRGNAVFFFRSIDLLIRAAFEINEQRSSV
jgi:hypothetical protein